MHARYSGSATGERRRPFVVPSLLGAAAALLVCGAPAPGPSGASRAGEPKAYVVNEITVTNAAKYKVYAQRVPSTLAPFGGTFIVRGGNPVILSGGSIAPRVVVLEFPSRAQALAWHDSAAYRKILAIRDASSRSRVYVVDAVP
jgi:uncharacterized protein (DUF1330 family)